MERQQLLDTYFEHVIGHAGFSPDGGRFYLNRLFDGVDFSGKRMLDIGGGRGIFSYYGACMGAREVVCVEPQGDGSEDDMHAVFRQVGDQLPTLDQVRLEIATIQDYDPKDATFDIILLHASINHLDEQACIRLHKDQSARDVYRGLLGRIAAMAAPGATLVACDVSRLNFFGHLGLRNPIAPEIEWHKHQPPRVWAELLSEVGFKNPRISWQNRRRKNALVRALLNNPLASYFLESYFSLQMDKERG